MAGGAWKLSASWIILFGKFFFFYSLFNFNLTSVWELISQSRYILFNWKLLVSCTSSWEFGLVGSNIRMGKVIIMVINLVLGLLSVGWCSFSRSGFRIPYCLVFFWGMFSFVVIEFQNIDLETIVWAFGHISMWNLIKKSRFF